MLNGLSLCYMDGRRWRDARLVCEALLPLTEMETNRALVRNRIRDIEKRMEAEEGEGGKDGKEEKAGGDAEAEGEEGEENGGGGEGADEDAAS